MFAQHLGANVIGWKCSRNRPSSWCLFKWLPTVLLSCGESDICFICEHRPCGRESDCERQDGLLWDVPHFRGRSGVCVWKAEIKWKSYLVDTNCFKVTSAYLLLSWWLLFISCRKLYLYQAVLDIDKVVVRIAKNVCYIFGNCFGNFQLLIGKFFNGFTFQLRLKPKHLTWIITRHYCCDTFLW